MSKNAGEVTMAKSSKATPKKQPHVIEEVDPKTLRRDPNQPRRHHDSEVIADLAASVAQQGIINAIEVNGDNVIVTGELRWRAAIEAGLKTVPVRRLTDLEPAQRFLRQLIENLQHNELNDQDLSSALAHLRELRRQGLLSAPGFLERNEPETPRSGRPKGTEPGSARDLAAIVGKTHTWILRHISDTYIVSEDIPEKLRPALADDQLHQDAVVAIRRLCPEPYREALIDRVALEATRGYIPTRGVQAVIHGLREVVETGGDEHTARTLIHLIDADERGSFIEAQVRVVMPQTPEERRAADAKDERSFANAVDAAGRQLASDERTAKFGRQPKVRDRVERLQAAAGRWLKVVDRLSRSKSTPTPLPPEPEPVDLAVTPDLSETERAVLQVLIIRAYTVGKPAQVDDLVKKLLPVHDHPAIVAALRSLVELGAVRREERPHPNPHVKTEQLYRVTKAQRFTFADGACASLARCNCGRRGF